jgi:hypothetical protein
MRWPRLCGEKPSRYAARTSASPEKHRSVRILPLAAVLVFRDTEATFPAREAEAAKSTPPTARHHHYVELKRASQPP